MAAKKQSALPTRVWSFEARFASVDDETCAFDLLRKSRRYYNALVENERKRRDQYEAIRRAEVPELVAVESLLAEQSARIDQLVADSKSARQEHWRKTKGEKVRLLPHEAELKAAKELRKALAERLKPLKQAFNEALRPAQEAFKARATALADGGGPVIKGKANAAALDEMLNSGEWPAVWCMIARSDAAAQRRARDLRNTCQLPTGTYLATEEAFMRAQKDALPASPNFRRFDGGGRLALQIRDSDFSGLEALRRAPLLPGKKGDQSRMCLFDFAQKVPRGALHAIRLSVKMHRTPPADAAVKWVTLVVKREGSKMRVLLQFTLEHASFAEEKRPIGVRKPVHLHLGWASGPEGVRMASWAGGQVTLPFAILNQKGFADHLQAVADGLFEEMKRRLRRVTTLSGSRLTAWHRMRSAPARRTLRQWCVAYADHVLGDAHAAWKAWKSVRKSRGEDLYASFAEVCRSGIVPTRTQSFALYLYVWARKDEHLVTYSEHSRQRFVHRRDAFFRAEAIRLSTDFESLTIDNFSVAELKEKEDLTRPGISSGEAGRSQAQSSAPGRFREILQDVMGARLTKTARVRDLSQTAS